MEQEYFVLLEEVISRFIDKLFKGYEVKSVTAFVLLVMLI